MESIAESCTQLVYLDVDDTDLTDNGAKILAKSCPNLQYAYVGGTYVTILGVIALAQRCSWAKAAKDKMPQEHQKFLRDDFRYALCNLCVYRLPDYNLSYSSELRQCFPTITFYP